MLMTGESPDTATYSALATLLVERCRKENVTEADNVFDEMLHRRVVPDLVSFGCSQGKDILVRHWCIFRNMMISGLTLDTVIYTVLIDGFCRNDILSEALKMRNEMLEHGLLWMWYVTILYEGIAHREDAH
ncbi:putative Pentatricopeptide repeat-containing protein [Quillaja saponaria]|uniref:Pentatricopeptide repeat-containing protein n=1 Tax=Quillaja saponaria TaxID=32244 RepID=A0AAD7LMA9_QUISA|nr:putative Pentatricopeptide repeat-containing protein [Quillaja saponaria]